MSENKVWRVEILKTTSSKAALSNPLAIYQITCPSAFLARHNAEIRYLADSECDLNIEVISIATEIETGYTPPGEPPALFDK